MFKQKLSWIVLTVVVSFGILFTMVDGQTYSSNEEPFTRTLQAEVIADQKDMDCVSEVKIFAAKSVCVSAPMFPHVTVDDESEMLAVFSRIDMDLAIVSHYEAVFDSGYVTPLAGNYLTVEPWMREGSTVSFRAVLLDGTLGPLSKVLELPRRDSDNESEPDATGEADGKVSPPEATASVSVPQLVPPFSGPFSILYAGTSGNATSGPWGYWQHKTGAHKPGGGIGGADDTYAFDVNLNLSAVSSAGRDLDRGMDFYAVASGKVVKWYGTIDSTNSATKPVLIEHGSSTSRWWSGYLHATTINVRPGDYVTADTRIGKVGNAGVSDGNNHLHFIQYVGSNAKSSIGRSLLVSVNPSFGQSSLSIRMPGSQSIRRGEYRQLSTWAYGSRPYSVNAWNLNGSSLIGNTLWTSSRSTVATVDRYGTVRGIAPGTATITAYFSGSRSSTTVSVY